MQIVSNFNLESLLMKSLPRHVNSMVNNSNSISFIIGQHYSIDSGRGTYIKSYFTIA